jgi:hypothetical protein
MFATQYLGGDSFPKFRGKSTPRCSIPGVETLVCGSVPLMLTLSSWMLKAEALLWPPSRDAKSARINRSLERTVDLRHLFLNETVFKRFPMRKSHSHAEAASYRTAMNHFMVEMVKSVGMEPYMVSMSAGDAKSHMKGTRLYYGLKDLAIPYKNDEMGDNDVLIMVDVDYYADMNEWLRYNRPILLYTLVPEVAAGRGTDFAYRLVDNNVEFRVAGGSCYKHQIWDYGREHVGIVNNDGTMTTFLVEQRRIPGDPMHRFVVLTPEVRVSMPYWKYMEELVEPLKRWEPLKEGVNTLYEPVTDTLSLSVNASWQSVEISGRVYSAIQSRVQAKPAAYTVADIERLLNGAEAACKVDRPNDGMTMKEASMIAAPLLYGLMNAKLDANVINTNGTLNYLPIAGLCTDDGKPSGALGATPIVSQPAVVPMNALASDIATVNGRIKSQINSKVPPLEYKTRANQFLQRLIPEKDVGVGVPLSVEEVRQRQNRPAQQARYDMIAATLSNMDSNKLKSFVKVEAYASVTDPRNITTMSAELTTLLSGYTLAFKENVLKQHYWYGPGLTPEEQIARLRSLSLRGKNLLSTDYSRLDGTVSEWLQKCITIPAYMRWVNPKYKSSLQADLLKVFVQRGRTSHGVPFSPGFGTRSGSPITTCSNTMICAFVVFCAYIRLGFTPEEAWKAMGLYFGDDGATAADEGLADAIEAVANDLGLKLKCEVIQRGQPFPYLGRYFVDLSICNDSFQDPLRTISKLHITANRELSPEQAMANKALGYYVTDKETPLIGTWADAVLDITGLTKMKNATREEEYKASNTWPQQNKHLIDEAFATVFSKQTGRNVTASEIAALDDVLRGTKALDRFPVLLELEREVKIAAVVDGEIVYPPSPTPHVSYDNDRPISSSEPEPARRCTCTPKMAENGPRCNICDVAKFRREAKRIRPKISESGHANGSDDTVSRPKSNRNHGGASNASRHRRAEQPQSGERRPYTVHRSNNSSGEYRVQRQTGSGNSPGKGRNGNIADSGATRYRGQDKRYPTSNPVAGRKKPPTAERKPAGNKH